MALPLDPELATLIQKALAAPPMTASELRTQRISWAYGNCAIENPNVTREMVERVHDEIYGRIEE